MKEQKLTSFKTFFKTESGVWMLTGTNNKITAFKPSACGKVQGNCPKEFVSRISDYFEGKSKKIEFSKFEFSGTPFQRSVWKTLCDIPWGQTATYSEIASKIGKPSAVRAVASAIGDNPIAVLVPCHRVIGKNGKLSGYAWGLKKKSWLLAHEKRYNK